MYGYICYAYIGNNGGSITCSNNSNYGSMRQNSP